MHLKYFDLNSARTTYNIYTFTKNKQEAAWLSIILSSLNNKHNDNNNISNKVRFDIRKMAST